MKTFVYTFFTLLFFGCCNKTNDIGEIIIATNPIKAKQKKTHEQFIQIAHIDLFNKTINPQRLTSISNTFDSQEDDNINYQLFVKMIIEEATSQMPSDGIMKTEREKFIEESYLKFYSRYPNGYETKMFTELIVKDTAITTQKIYYLLMTSEEYRFF